MHAAAPSPREQAVSISTQGSPRNKHPSDLFRCVLVFSHCASVLTVVGGRINGVLQQALF